MRIIAIEATHHRERVGNNWEWVDITDNGQPIIIKFNANTLIDVRPAWQTQNPNDTIVRYGFNDIYESYRAIKIEVQTIHEFEADLP